MTAAVPTAKGSGERRGTRLLRSSAAFLGCHSLLVSRRERLIRLVAPSLMAYRTRYRQRMARIENGMPVVREEHPGGKKKPVFGPPFRDHLRQGGEF
jgi:hypothetical protein